MSERIIVSNVRAYDASTGAYVELAPGAAIVNWRIERHCQAEIDGGADPYAVRFNCQGREYRCPLPVFLARTQAAETAGEVDAVAV